LLSVVTLYYIPLLQQVCQLFTHIGKQYHITSIIQSDARLFEGCYCYRRGPLQATHASHGLNKRHWQTGQMMGHRVHRCV